MDLPGITGFPPGLFVAIPEAGDERRLQQPMECDLPDGGNGLWPGPGPRSGRIVTEDAIEHPAQATFDALVATDSAGEGRDIQLDRAEMIPTGRNADFSGILVGWHRTLDWWGSRTPNESHTDRR
ncbi:MAG: hypothetical protein ACREFY_00615 [Acetobacteraceae bacterium]